MPSCTPVKTELAVSEQGRRPLADAGFEERIVPFARQRWTLEEWNLDVEDGAIAGKCHVMCGDERQPHAIVRDVSAHALATVWQPPMLHIALGKLARSGAQDLIAQQLGLRQPQRHRVLQLIAESIGAAGLVEAGASPGAAGQRLIEQPAIHHDVERTVWRLDLHVSRELFPMRTHRIEYRLDLDAAITGQ